MSRTDITNTFRRHKSSERLKDALALLLNKGLARMGRSSTRGRPVETWYATEANQ